VVSGSEAEVEQVVMDKGYHDNGLLAWCASWGLRTYLPERKQKSRTWQDKPEEFQAAFRANRRRVRGPKGRRLNRLRSERCERSFAHVCETGGGRRMWLRGLVNASKSHLMRCCAHNLALLMRKCFGMGKPRSWGNPSRLAPVLGCAIALAMTATLGLSLGVPRIVLETYLCSSLLLWAVTLQYQSTCGSENACF